MSPIINWTQFGQIALSAAIGLVALALTAFAEIPPAPSDSPQPVQFDVPAGGRWCAPQDGVVTRTCRYDTFEHCLVAASGYGTCRPNPAAVLIIDEGPYRTYHSMSRSEHATVMVD
jgi:hypothetical protein